LQIIYAAPFVLLSILSFAICLAVPSLRRFALPALIVPVTFGFCSIVSWVAFVLIAGHVLKLHLGPATGVHGLLEGLFFYCLPGVLASWVAISAVGFVHRSILRTQIARDIVLRLVISAVAGFAGGIIGFGVAGNSLPYGSVVATLEIASVAAGLSAALAFLLTMRVQRRGRKRKGLPSAPDPMAE
jgi:hypothetical protein